MTAHTPVTEEAILNACRVIEDPDLHKNIVDLGFIKDLKILGGAVSLTVELTTPACPIKELFKNQVEEAVGALPGVTSVEATMTSNVTAGPPSLPDRQAVPGVKNIIGVGSGKGGVGKSTVAVNVALGLAATGASVGLMDADIYGPNVPMMLGTSDKPQATDDDKILPVEAHGIKVISMGMLLEPDKAVVWRGPMLNSVVRQFLYEVKWGELDYLVVDLPPGTGDVQLTLAQAVPITGAIIVTTPQAVSLADARKAISMFNTTSVPILGIVENMSTFGCPHCGEGIDVFGHGGGERAAEELGVPFLGAIPLDPAVRAGGDAGAPALLDAPDSETGQALDGILKKIAAQISIQNYATATASHDTVLTPENSQ